MKPASDPLQSGRLYCYVDETGQDTHGELFIVAVILTDNRRDAANDTLERIEQSSGKGKAKWISSRPAARAAYVRTLISAPLFKGTLHFSTYRGTKSYMALTVLSTAKAILQAGPQNGGRHGLRRRPAQVQNPMVRS